MGILKSLTIALTPDITSSSHTPIPPEHLKRWITANSGRFVPKVVPGTTHLIASSSAYKRGVEAVKLAQNLNIPIVTYDWLEDSLQKGRRLVEKKYLLERVRAQRRTRRVMKRLGPGADKKKFDDGCELAKKDLGSGTLMTMNKKKEGFFARAVEELRGRREERERVEKEKAEMAERERAVDTGPVSFSRAADAPDTTHSTPSKRLSTGREDERHPGTSTSSSSTIAPTPAPSNTSAPTPTPSLFPPSLAYTPPSSSSSSSGPNPPPHPTTLTPTTNTPANPRLQDLYHIHMDATGFSHSLLLLRPYPTHNTFARYDLRLYESHTLPHVYCTVVRYIPPAIPPPTSSAPPHPPHPPHPSQPGSESEATRLHSLITPPTPSAAHPYRTTLVPPSSGFAPAFRAFRHAFRDLTLLAWEERFDGELQRLRARAMGVRVFEWRGPGEGLPRGSVVRGVGMGVGELGGDNGGKESGNGEGYRWNEWGLPGVEGGVGLEREGWEEGREELKEVEGGKKKKEEQEVGEMKARVRGKMSSASGKAIEKRRETPMGKTSTTALGTSARSGTPGLPRGATPGRGKAIFLGDFDPRPAARRLWPSER